MAASDMMVIVGGEAVADDWIFLDDDGPLGTSPSVISPARLHRDAATLQGHNGKIGVRLSPSADLAVVTPFLALLSLVVLDFPEFRDGRGFSLARALRERGFAGDVRAAGHLLPDQYMFLTRCGVSSVELPEHVDLGPWREALQAFHVAYQCAANDVAPLSPLRRRLL